MNKKMNLKFLGTALSVLLLAGSCKKDKNDNPAPNNDKGFYSLGVQMPDFTNYILSTNDIKSGSISPIGNGVEAPGAEFIQSGNYFYFFSRPEKKFFQYELKADGTVAQKASLLVTQYITDRAYSQNLIDANTILIMDPLKWGDPEIKWFTIRIPEFVVAASGTLTLPTMEKTAGVNWKVNVGKGALHGNKFIMGTVYYDNDGNYANGSYAVVMDYPAMTNPTRIETQLTSAELGGITNTTFAKTANGDLYIAGYRGFYGVPSTNGVYGSVLRIKNGEYDFDENYLFDLTAKLGEPTQVMQLDFLEGQSAMGMLFNPKNITDWQDLDNDHYYFAKIDLPSKTISKFNMPKADVRLARKPWIANGKYITYLKSAAANTTTVLEINYNGGADAFSLGKTIEGSGVVGYSVVKHPAE